MHEIEHRLDRLARSNDDVISRAAALAVGASDDVIRSRLDRGVWQPLQAGVYLVGSAPPTWQQRLRAAVAAAGPGAMASHRAAMVLWSLDGVANAPLEINAPHHHNPMPEEVVVHRTRRVEPPSAVDGIVVTGVERTLLEVGAVCHPVVVEKGLASALRRGLTTWTKVDAYLRVHAGKGRRGVTALRETLALYAGSDRAPGSDGEVAFLRALRAAGVEPPVCQWTIDLAHGAKATLDFAWPARRKAVEFVGWTTHSDSRAQDADTWREDAIRAAGWDLRRFAPHSLRHRPEAVAAAVRSLLGRDLGMSA